MDEQLFISVIIPLFNGEKYIAECISSCLKQDIGRDKYEIIVVDDGSTDGGVSIVKEFAKTYENVRLIENEHRGVSVARNTGLINAKGVYVWFVDCDDMIKKDCFNALYTKCICDGQDKIRFKGYSFSDKRELESGDMDGQKTITYWGYPWISVFKREPCIKNGIFFNEDIAIGEDELFNLEYDILTQTEAVVYDDVLYYYRIHNGQAMNYALKDPIFRSMQIMKRTRYLSEKLRIDERYAKSVDFILKSTNYALRMIVDEQFRKARRILKEYEKMGVLPCKILYSFVDKDKVPTRRSYFKYYNMYNTKWNTFKDRVKHPVRSVKNLLKRCKI